MKFETQSVECYRVICHDCYQSVIVYSADKGHDWMQGHLEKCGGPR